MRPRAAVLPPATMVGPEAGIAAERTFQDGQEPATFPALAAAAAALTRQTQLLCPAMAKPRFVQYYY